MSVAQANDGEMELHTHEIEDVYRCLHSLEDATTVVAVAVAVNRRARKLWKMEQPRLNDDQYE